MKYRLLIVTGLFFLFSCSGRNSHSHKDTLSNKETDTSGTAKIETAASDSTNQGIGAAVKIKRENSSSASDTTWFPFKDSSYQLNVHIFNTDASSEDEINSVITYNLVNQGKTKQIFQDSFYCMDNGYMLRQDFNNDHIDDILIFCSSGARANPTYHLFLADAIRHKLTYVKGFEELPNPSMDPVYNVITSLALSGTSDYRFYQINSKKKLIRLGHGYKERDNDSTQYERAIRAIIVDRQRREAQVNGN
jgi:hypothetical protein